jgi:tRNA (mo5U34)-methyltransferase
MNANSAASDLDELASAFERRLAGIKAARTDVSWYPYNSISNIGLLNRFLPSDLLERLRLGDGLSALDIGTADGDVAFFLESRGWSVDVIDNPPTNNYQCKGLLTMKEELSSNVGVNLMDVDRPFQLPRQYDLVLALGLLYHLMNPFAFLRSLVLHSERLLLSTRVARETREGLNIATVPGAYLLALRECNDDPTNFWIFTPVGLERLLTRCGWQIVAKLEAGNTERSNPVDTDKDERHFVYCKRVEGWQNIKSFYSF